MRVQPSTGVGRSVVLVGSVRPEHIPVPIKHPRAFISIHPVNVVSRFCVASASSSVVVFGKYSQDTAAPESECLPLVVVRLPPCTLYGGVSNSKTITPK